MQVLTGHCLPDDAPLPLYVWGSPDDWAPYCSQIEFKLAKFLFEHAEMLVANPLLTNHMDLYHVIDSMSVGAVKWEHFKITYKHNQDEPKAPWMFDIYDVWYRDPHQVIHNLLGCADIKDEMDFIPYWEFNAASDQRHWKDFINNPLVAGATLVPIILGSDKTTFSIATGQTDYYLLYLSIGNVCNTTCHAHCDAVVLIGFLAMLKMTREHANTQVFHKFKKQLFHSLLAHILQSLGPVMTVLETVLFACIADYEEQVLLSCIVCKWCPKCLAHWENLDEDALWHHHKHTELISRELGPLTLWDEYGIDRDIVPFTIRFPHADIQRMLFPDILHQLIKGGFKDHLVDWVERYILQPLKAMSCRMSVHTFCAFLEFCYLDALAHFHSYCEVFWNAQVVTTFSLPWQHAMKHYPYLICQFGALNGLCSSITKSKHIKAVKWPYQHTNHFQALGQMLVINQRLDKFAAVHADFEKHGMSRGTCLSHVLVNLEQYTNKTSNETNHNVSNNQDCKDGADEPTASFEEDPGDMDNSPMDLATKLNIPQLLNILRCFLQLQLQQDVPNLEDVPLDECPFYDGCICVYNSASSTFYAPSDVSGLHSMNHKHIHCSPTWRNKGPCYDCVFIVTNPHVEGMLGLDVTCILCMEYPCVIVCWFDHIGDGPDTCTGMWIVCACNTQDIAIIHINTIYHAAQLIPAYANHQINPASIKPNKSYNKFLHYYVNKFADHHAFEITS
ncbi:hypothetical protein F5J12DRAFT_907013 [Pisolithus orientalis]|uniref:uncharacterized protein n=1 Tax=Pisolithus orientalis TaxID=936130 RepID=UPI002224E5BC|nr:uncharacterized protein F5J12DRAFT_907013 [Pisolithus orientalis]KAI5996903.1 hypothetical protein F5J12DRAFT_907013 [Pisolithus orientalis]